MPQITFVWAALGLLIGLFARLAGARSAYPRGVGRWASLARWALSPTAVALATTAGGWLASLVVGRLAATAAALGVAAVIALLIALQPQRGAASGTPVTHDAPTP